MNDLTTLNSKLDTQLNDAADTVWPSAEKNDALTWAVAGLWPRVSLPNDPTTDTEALVAETYFYDVPDTLGAVSKLYLLDADDAEVGFLPSGAWELTDQRPFVSQDVLLRSARPDGATQVCVTPATFDHAVVDPTVFHCLPLPG